MVTSKVEWEKKKTKENRVQKKKTGGQGREKHMWVSEKERMWPTEKIIMGIEGLPYCKMVLLFYFTKPPETKPFKKGSKIDRFV